MLNLTHRILGTWEGWSDIVIPALGAILIPLLILWLTWLFGTSRADQKAEKQRNEENLIYLRSLLFHALKDFLMFRNKIIFKRTAIYNYDKLTTLEKKHLFAVFYCSNIYYQFEPKEYALLGSTLPSFIINLIQTKTYMRHTFNRMEMINKDIEERQNNVASLILLMRDNLKTFQSDIDDAIKSIKTTLDDISYLEKTLKLNLVQLELEDFEKQELEETLSKFKEINTEKING